MFHHFLFRFVVANPKLILRVKASESPKTFPITKHHDDKQVTPLSFTIPSNVSQHFISDPFDLAPISRVVIALLEETQYNGDHAINPFGFQKHGLPMIRILRGSVCWRDTTGFEKQRSSILPESEGSGSRELW